MTPGLYTVRWKDCGEFTAISKVKTAAISLIQNQGCQPLLWGEPAWNVWVHTWIVPPAWEAVEVENNYGFCGQRPEFLSPETPVLSVRSAVILETTWSFWTSFLTCKMTE